ncbi:hypothetical protein B0H10DRAFT_2068268, partial [Mycena sp. CBHHK59/15]
MFTPRTVAIIWSVALVGNLVSFVACIYSLSLNGVRGQWFFVVLAVVIGFCACSAAFNTWRFWKIHRAQTQAMRSLPQHMAPPPVVPT